MSDALSRRHMLAGAPALAAAMAVPAAATALPQSLDAMLESVDREKREHICGVIIGWLNARRDAETGAPDPVFEAIEAYRLATEEIQKVFYPDGYDGLDEEDDDETQDAKDAAVRARNEALLDFFLTEPTTIAGALAALEHGSTPGEEAASLADEAFHNGPDFQEACAAWPAMIASNIRRIIETHAWINPGLFGPLVVKAGEREVS